MISNETMADMFIAALKEGFITFAEDYKWNTDPEAFDGPGTCTSDCDTCPASGACEQLANIAGESSYKYFITNYNKEVLPIIKDKIAKGE